MWNRIEEVFVRALEHAPETRGGYLDKECGTHEDLRTEVESLLAAHEQSRDFIEVPAVAFAAELLPDALLDEQTNGDESLVAGRRTGNYQIARELGRGGMGVVYLAHRADDQYRKSVAVKVVRRGMNTDDILRRFRNERQILAGLEHPNIAGLFDGGQTSDGLPYIIMEYVEGTPVTDYCDQHRLTTNERLQLFRIICAAVQHAHQHSVVHRDLKPSNILITSDATPKLLDFGIAKVLSTDLTTATLEQTHAELRVLTPDYASPEQFRGETLTTASDIYSLGVVLYELLTGHRPYHALNHAPHEIARVICEQEPTKPSTAANKVEVVTRRDTEPDSTITPEAVSLARDTQPDKLQRRLSGDLDNIILMAMRKEPHRRYESAAQFAADIGRHLEGLPVIARKATFKYRATKFVKRNKVGVVAAALIILTLMGGVALTIREARIAQVERARAERRFNDVRKLAKSNLFELHDAIETLPGSTPARELLVKRALEYLDSLAQESGDDPSLQRELVEAYLKVGKVQGNPTNPNLGDTAGAMHSYRQALSIAEQLAAANPTDAQARRSLGIAQEKMSDMQSATGDISGAVENARRALAAFKALAEAAPANIAAGQTLAISHIKMGDVLGNPNFPNSGDQAAALMNYRMSSAMWQSLDKLDPDNPKTRRFLGLVYERIGTMLELEGNIVEAHDNYRESQVIRQQIATNNPDNTEAVRDAAIAHEKVGNIMTTMGNLTAALESRRQSLEIFNQLAEADSRNVLAQQSLAISYMHLGELLGDPDSPNLGRRDEALKNYRTALEILQPVKDSDSTNAKTQSTLERVNNRMQRLIAKP